MILSEAQLAQVRRDLAAGEVDIAFIITLEGVSLGMEVTAAQWGNDTSGPSISADITLADVLPRRLEGGAVKFDIGVNGILVPQAMGRQSYSDTAGGSSGGGSQQSSDLQKRAVTDLIFATNAIHFQETTLDDYVEYDGWTPEDVLRDAISRVGYRHTSIYPVGEPLLYYTHDRNDSRFKPEQTVADIVSAVAPQTNWVMRDTGNGGFIAAPDIELGRDASVPAQRHFNSGDIVDWRRPPRKGNRYSDVVVFRVNPDGTDDYREIAPVFYRNQIAPAHHNAFYISLPDDSPDANEKATQLAYDMARRFGRGVFADTITWPYFDPTLEQQQPFRVDDYDRDIEGSWQRSWLCWVDTFKQQLQWNASSTGGGSGATGTSGGGSSGAGNGLTPTASTPLSSVVDYTGTLLEESKVEIPTLIVPGISTNILTQLFYIAAQGLSARTDISNAVTLDVSDNDTAGRYFEPTTSRHQIILNTTGLYITGSFEGAVPFTNEAEAGVHVDPAIAMTSQSGMLYANIDRVNGAWINTTYSGTHAQLVTSGSGPKGFYLDLNI